MSGEAVGIDTGRAEHLASRCGEASAAIAIETAAIRSRLIAADLPTTVALLADEVVAHLDRVRDALTTAVAGAVTADRLGGFASGGRFGFGGGPSTGPHGFGGGAAPTTGPLPAGTPADVAAELASRLRDWHLGDVGDLAELAALYESLIELLREHGDDPEFLAAFFAELGPDGLVKLPIDMAQAADILAGNTLMSADDRDRLATTPRVQHDVMVLLGRGLAHASTAGVLDDDLADQLVEVVTDGTGPEGWALSQILRNGTYDAGFLVTIADGLDRFERDHGQPGMWRDRSARPPYGELPVLGSQRDPQYFDPWTGLFEAMSRTPDAALDFFYPDGPPSDATPSPRADYYIRGRTWAHDDFAALTAMLAAAAVVHHDDIHDPDGARSAQIAADAINLLGTRRGGLTLGDDAKAALGGLFAAYIADVGDIAAWGYDPDTPTDGQLWSSARGPTAPLLVDPTRTVLWEAMTDTTAVEEIFAAANEWNAVRMQIAAESTDAERAWELSLKSATRDSAFLTGFLVGAAGYSNLQDAKAADDRAKAVIDGVSAVVSLIPVGGKPLKIATTYGTGYAVDVFADHEPAAIDGNFDLRVLAEQNLIVATGIAMGNAERYGPAGQLTDQGRRFDWFDPDGAFDPEIAAAERSGAGGFIAYVGGDHIPALMNGFTADMSAELARGLEHGSAGR